MASDLATKETSEATAAPELIRSLRLKNYRGFEDYRLNDLRRVNLLVGDNNAGKTAILEAVHLLAAGGDFSEFSRIGQRRGELAYLADNDRSGPPRRLLMMEHFFRGRRLTAGSRFSIAPDDHEHGIVVSYEDANKLEDKDRRHMITGTEALGPGPIMFFQVDHKLGTGGSRTHFTRSFTKEGGTYFYDPSQGRSFYSDSDKPVPIQFISQDSLDRDSLAGMWDAVQMEGKEQEVVDALKILDDTVDRIIFLVGEGYRDEARSGTMLGYEGKRRAVPLGSQGEGMRRMLGLALGLVSCQNGVLLIDEIDTGLHYSIMGDVWRLVAETAERYNVQVFATTHSFDCLKGLDWLCRSHPDLGEEVSLQKIEPALAFAVSADADKIRIVLEQNIEVR